MTILHEMPFSTVYYLIKLDGSVIGELERMFDFDTSFTHYNPQSFRFVIWQQHGRIKYEYYLMDRLPKRVIENNVEIDIDNISDIDIGK